MLRTGLNFIVMNMLARRECYSCKFCKQSPILNSKSIFNGVSPLEIYVLRLSNKKR